MVFGIIPRTNTVRTKTRANVTLVKSNPRLAETSKSYLLGIFFILYSPTGRLRQLENFGVVTWGFEVGGELTRLFNVISGWEYGLG